MSTKNRRRALFLPLLASVLSLSAQAQSAPKAAPEPEAEPQAPAAPPRASGGAPPSDDAFKMGSPPALPQGVTEEEMWPAATAEQWKQPSVVRWQRTFDDAIRVARAERRPILVAVNMDGEIASEHYAGVRYREPATGELMARYVCVICSVYRHTPRDYDEEGRRVECPRFGTVTCGEHIEAERELYEKYFDGKRISPRHIVLDANMAKAYDVYFSWDTDTVFTTFKKGVEGWAESLDLMEHTVVDLAKSADITDRQTLERQYAEGDRDTKRAILQTLQTEPVVDQTEILRAAIFGFDLELAGMARHALARCSSEGALDLIAEALKAPLEASERQVLLDAVARIAETSPRARTLAALHSGLSLDSQWIDAEAAERGAAAEGSGATEEGVNLEARAAAAEERPADPDALLALAEGLLARSEEAADKSYRELLLADARSAAAEAERLGAKGPRLDAIVALAAANAGDVAGARARAVAAVEGGLLADEADAASGGAATELSAKSRTRLLQLFAGARQRAIRDAFRAGDSWPPAWLSDVNAAYAEIAEDPSIGAETLVDYYDFLRWIGATPRANAVLDDALQRFPDSPLAHERLRARLLWEGGPRGLERGYAERTAVAAEAAGSADATLAWFSGYASIVAAEHHRRRGELDAAVAAYGRAVESYRKSAELAPDGSDTCLHFIALSRAGCAQIALERGELAEATDALLEAFELRPDSVATADGLGILPTGTAKMLHARLIEAGDEERAGRVQAALDALDPRLLEPPPSEPANLGRGRRGR